MEVNKKVFTQYNFFELFCILVILKKKLPILNKEQLQNDLTKLYQVKQFECLFNNMTKKTNIEKENYIDLSIVLEIANNLGLISLEENNIIINMNEEEAFNSMSKYEAEKINLMNKLVALLLLDSKKTNNKKSSQKIKK